ncbi:hypothetical protein [Actinophytocola sp. KF-1]
MIGQEHARGAWPTAVAIEVLLLWPRGVAKTPVTVDEAGLWPVFAMVVAEPPDEGTGSARPLFELLAEPGPSVVAADTSWSVIDPARALLGVTVRGVVPVEFGLRVLLPAARVLGVLDVVAGGGTIGITTRDRAGGLRDRVDIRTALDDLVLLSCPPSVELAALAGTLRASR